MSLKTIGRKEYLKFSAYEGSQHIASEYAIIRLLQIVKRFEVSSILEVGLGIGSISSSILKTFRAKQINYIGTETNDFCLESLKKNLEPEDYKSLQIIDSIETAIQLNTVYDLVIIDGNYENMLSLKPKLTKHAIIIIEGDRKPQEDDIKSVFPRAKSVHSISYKKNDPKGTGILNHWQGGIKLFFVNPTFNQTLLWMTEKVRTKAGYFYRKHLYKK